MMENKTMRQQSAKELFPALISLLTDGKAEITTLETPTKTTFQVLAPAEVMGLIIGKNGSTESALRRLLVGFSGRDNHSYWLEIN